MASARTLKLGIAALASFLVVSCADARNPLDPAQQPLLARSSGASSVSYQALTRGSRGGSAKVQQVISASTGGTISAGGVSLSFTGGELRKDRPIKLTVPAGDYFEARFNPHGLRFNSPAKLCFDLAGLNVDPSDLVGIYLGNKGLERSGRITDPEETIPATVSDGEVCIPVRHFSGYIVASGRTR
ncbi:MAG: hypothetical protein WD766_11325 [Gemmatimonadota bacterium]